MTQSIERAAGFIRSGGIAAFPTETVYGLGAAAFDDAAIRKIFTAKGRPADNPLIAHISSLSQIKLLASQLTPCAYKFILNFFPGPLTVILPKHRAVPAIATAGLDTIGIRMPADEVAREFLDACATPVVAPSANRSGRPSPTTWQAVRDDLNGRIPCILQSTATHVGLESTVVDCTGDIPLVLRAGAVTLEQLRDVVPATRLHRPRANAKPRSPGLKHRHYAPQARVVLVAAPDDARRGPTSAFIGIGSSQSAVGFAQATMCRDVADYAHFLFRFFRECDAAGIKTIYCQTVPEDGLGAALTDRLRRAAAR